MLANFHSPVLVREVLSHLEDLREDFVFLDCTIGGGGHSKAVLEKFPASKIIGLDQDQAAVEESRKKLAFYQKRVFFLLNCNFRNLKEVLAERNFTGQIDVIFFDLGISSYQLNHPERGFSFRVRSPLDMRMDKRGKITAAEVVNTFPEEKLSSIIAEYGEEKFTRKVTRAIISHRPIEDTLTLSQVIEKAIGFWYRGLKIHPATRTFQALRIFVNDEINALKAGLEQGFSLLGSGGKIMVISYHSLEDREVKHFFRELRENNLGGKIVTSKPIRPTAEEVKKNPRARSAKLRIFQKG